MSKLKNALTEATNMIGPMSKEYQGNILKYFNLPSEELWEEIAHYLITPDTTIWQAWIKVDYKAPRRGRRTDLEGNVVNAWENIPTVFMLNKAITETVNQYKSV